MHKQTNFLYFCAVFSGFSAKIVSKIAYFYSFLSGMVKFSVFCVCGAWWRHFCLHQRRHFCLPKNLYIDFVWLISALDFALNFSVFCVCGSGSSPLCIKSVMLWLSYSAISYVGA